MYSHLKDKDSMYRAFWMDFLPKALLPCFNEPGQELADFFFAGHTIPGTITQLPLQGERSHKQC